MDGGSVLDVVIEVVCLFEECLLFNVGKGLVFISVGMYEFDVLIMDGVMLVVGVVICVKCLCNLIFVVCVVMECSEYVLFIFEGVEVFVQVQGLEFVELDYYYIEVCYV